MRSLAGYLGSGSPCSGGGRFSDIVRAGSRYAEQLAQGILARELEALAYRVGEMTRVDVSESPRTTEADWVTVVAPGELAMYMSDAGAQEVKIADWRYTPQGLMYELKHSEPDVKWMVAAQRVQPIHGSSRLIQVNLLTGESRPASE